MLDKGLPYFKKNGKIGIIGGTGRMGQWGLILFKKLGYKNLFFSGNKEKAKETEEKTKAIFIEDNKELAKISDMLIISVQINKVLEIINEVGP